LPKCIDYTGAKGSLSANKKNQVLDSTKEQRGNRRHLWSGGTGLSDVPPDSVRCARELQLKLATFGNSSDRRAIIHRTVRCTPDSVRCATGQCPVHQRTPTQTRHLREFLRPARYNSPDCPVLQGSAAFGTRQPRNRAAAAPL
jgi:hypothetical protein